MVLQRGCANTRQTNRNMHRYSHFLVFAETGFSHEWGRQGAGFAENLPKSGLPGRYRGPLHHPKNPSEIVRTTFWTRRVGQIVQSCFLIDSLVRAKVKDDLSNTTRLIQHDLSITTCPTRRSKIPDSASRCPMGQVFGALHGCALFGSTQKGFSQKGFSPDFSKTVFATNRAAIGRIRTILWGSKSGPPGHLFVIIVEMGTLLG